MNDKRTETAFIHGKKTSAVLRIKRSMADGKTPRDQVEKKDR